MALGRNADVFQREAFWHMLRKQWNRFLPGLRPDPAGGVPPKAPSQQGSFPVRKRTGTLRIWRARERAPIWGSGAVLQRVPWAEPLVRESGGEAPPPEAEGILLPKRANLSLSFKWNLDIAAICRKGPERRSGNQKKDRNGVPVRSGSKRTLLVSCGGGNPLSIPDPHPLASVISDLLLTAFSDCTNNVIIINMYCRSSFTTVFGWVKWWLFIVFASM